MSEVTTSVKKNKEGVEVLGIVTNDRSGGIKEFKNIITIPDRTEGVKRAFTLDNEKTLKIALYNTDGGIIDLDEVKKQVLIELEWAKGQDFTVTQTREGWNVKLESFSNGTQTENVVPSGNGEYTSVSVGVGNSG